MIFALALSALFLAGCSSSGSEAEASSRFDFLDDPRFAGMVEGISKSQREILADGFVTESEHEAAVRAVLACLDQKGIAHTEPVYDTSRYKPQWDYRVGPADDPGQLEAEFDDCLEEHFNAVSTALTFQYELPEEERAAREEQVLACLDGIGIEADNFRDFMVFGMNTIGDDERDGVFNCLELLRAK